MRKKLKLNKISLSPKTFVLGVIVTSLILIFAFYISSNFKSKNIAKVHFLKNWTIYYKAPLEADKIKNKNISVLDEKGNKVNCELTLAPYGKSIEILSPKNGYEEGKTYTLKIGSDEDCTIEKVYGKKKSIKFQILKEAADNTRIVFFDKNFESLIREEIKKPSGDIGVKDVKSITSLVLTSRNIMNLKGIEYFTNLHTLSLDVNRIKDIKPLKTLTDLNYLGLSNNNITDISSLKDHKYLKRLFLLGNSIKNYKVLDNISKNLETKDFN